jgi:hypothetical protein
MQQRQLRLGDILDDYCPRERRVTNHAVVAMVGPEVKQTRCTTCDAEHEYKHARVPRPRKKSDAAALYSQVAAGAPKAPSLHEPGSAAVSSRAAEETSDTEPLADASEPPSPVEEAVVGGNGSRIEPAAHAADDGRNDADERDEGPVHRPLIRASLPRPEGQAPASRPVPEFTIRQPGGRPNRFRPRHQRGGGGHTFPGNRSMGHNGGGQPRGMSRHGNRPPAHRHGNRKRSK